MFLGSFWPECSAGSITSAFKYVWLNIRSPAILLFLVYKMEPNNMQESPPGISNQPKIFRLVQPKLQNPYPQSVLGTWETVCLSMPQGTLFPCPSGRQIIGCPWTPLHPYAMGHCQLPCFHGLWNISAGYCACQGTPFSTHILYLTYWTQPQCPSLHPTSQA